MKKFPSDLNYETIERISELIVLNELERFKVSIRYIADDLQKEGFELSDIRKYLQMELTEFLGE